jgi:DNA repair protein RecN (Recombination protein N)
MLNHLRINNFALLENIEIDFEKGLSFFTGETGAGKSILIDAICRLLGSRATQEDVRAGASKAIIEAVFSCDELSNKGRKLLEEWQIEFEENELIVRREIQSSGKNRVAVNQCTLTVSQLRKLAPELVDIFGQNEHQSLLDSDSQRLLFDKSIGIEAKVRRLSEIAAEIGDLQNEWRTLCGNEQERQRNIDLLQYQIHEIEEASVSETEDQELQAKKLLLQNGERIQTMCASLLEDLLESDENLLKKIESLGKTVGELQKYDERLGEYPVKFMEWLDLLQDLVRKLDTMRQGLDFEESSLDQIEQRLDLLHRLKKKYGPTIPDVLQHLARCKADLQNNFRAEWRTEQVIQAVRKASDEYTKLAAEISAARKSGATKFSAKVEAELKQVALEKCRFRVSLNLQNMENDLSDEQMLERKYSTYGNELISFEIEPNPGEGFRELAKIASGGELSRLMLALKVVTQSGEGHCFIFDEIDAGIGGRVASQVGERLRRLSQQAQVLCVTHLPQVAAFGDQHYRVQKAVKSGRTITVVEHLAEQESVQELARMISGSEITETAMQHARELRKQVGAVAG